MGHTRADVFRRHYMHQTVKVDTQSVYLGTTNRTDLIKTIGLMNKKARPPSTNQAWPRGRPIGNPSRTVRPQRRTETPNDHLKGGVRDGRRS